MLIEEILDYCNNEYTQKRGCCKNCNHPCRCPDSCAECLRQIHYEHAQPEARHSYDCNYLANYYVCKYSLKYASEMYYALSGLENLASAQKLNVFSIGCGPCTDLFALNYLSENGDYKYEKLNYIGVDILRETWGKIHNKIAQSAFTSYGINAKYIYCDIQIVLDKLVREEFKPDLIVMNYFLSDYHKYGSPEKVLDFLNRLVYYISKVCPDTTIIINDINLNCSRGGGREYYDTLLKKLQPMGFKCSRMHFNNSNKENHYEYGTEYYSNNLVFPDEVLWKYNYYRPFDSCSGAQIIIYKE